MARPSFAAAWAASQRIYNPAAPLETVARIVGGAVAANIHNKEKPWKNTCAVRISYILNQAGLSIPAIPGQTVTGADHRNYFFRVQYVIQFLKHRWGAPEVIPYPPLGGGALVGKKGIVLFEIRGWGDAAGHATLFNGTVCYDHCYFNEPGVKYTTTQANFWSLP